MKIIFSAAGLVAIGIVAAILGSIPKTAEAGSTIYVGQRAAGRVSMDKVDHSGWDKLLRKHVDEDGYVNYKSWHASSSDRQSLSAYLNTLSKVNPQASASRDAKLAFWINAYNAVTIHGILREYPTSSIRNHTARLFGYNIWKDLQLYVGGRAYSLEAIEHQTLRKMNEPRIHFAIVCASIGCPRLLNEAYTATRVQQQLEINAKDFFGRAQNFRYDARSRRFHLSSILSWFDDDFGSEQNALLRTIAKWLPDKTSQAAARSGSGSISYLDYNWNLNDQSSRRVARR
ncbi:MAG: hypothetical protein ACI93T_002903 [Porticoccaceae bacterium]|jgi:hypothetical protein